MCKALTKQGIPCRNTGDPYCWIHQKDANIKAYKEQMESKENSIKHLMGRLEEATKGDPETKQLLSKLAEKQGDIITIFNKAASDLVEVVSNKIEEDGEKTRDCVREKSEETQGTIINGTYFLANGMSGAFTEVINLINSSNAEVINRLNCLEDHNSHKRRIEDQGGRSGVMWRRRLM